jgi:site-specific recombinase XerD
VVAERLGDRSARGVTPGDIEKLRREFIASKEQRPKPATVNRYLTALKTAFSFALVNGKVEKNPVRTVKMERENNERIRFLTRDEEARLLEATPTKYHPLITVAIHTGLRKSEMLNLEWRDIDFKRNQLTVTESKSDKGRIVPLSGTATATFRELSRVRLIDNVYVFPGEIPGERMKDLPKYWEEHRKKAGLEDLHWHDLRHTFASRLVMGGVDLYTSQQAARPPRRKNDHPIRPPFARSPVVSSRSLRQDSWGPNDTRTDTKGSGVFISSWSCWGSHRRPTHRRSAGPGASVSLMLSSPRLQRLLAAFALRRPCRGKGPSE